MKSLDFPSAFHMCLVKYFSLQSRMDHSAEQVRNALELLEFVFLNHFMTCEFYIRIYLFVLMSKNV